MTYEPLPDDELQAIVEHDGYDLPREAIVASQRFLAEKLLEAQIHLIATEGRLRTVVGVLADAAAEVGGWEREAVSILTDESYNPRVD